MIRTLALAMGATMAAAQTGLINKGVSGCTTTKRCGLCQGDCDSDKGCNPNLSCFQRSGNQPIPGCKSGGKMDVRGFDFCYFKNTGNSMGLVHHNLVNKGWNGCTNTKPCQMCEGDCDSDKQCVAPLKCFQRSGTQAVPGCTSGGKGDKKSADFCYDATAGNNMGLVHHNLVNKGISGCSNTKPCSLCEGDCDNDKQCVAPLKCFQRNGMQAIPGCTMNKKNNRRGFDFCYDATAGNNMGLQHHNLVNKGASGCSPTKRCALCQGDCDSDRDCLPSLKCFQRSGMQAIPGCNMKSHGNQRGFDYCYFPRGPGGGGH